MAAAESDPRQSCVRLLIAGSFRILSSTSSGPGRQLGGLLPYARAAPTPKVNALRRKNARDFPAPAGSKEPRGMTNRIEATFQDSLITTFDAPPAGTKLEGATGPGDSGGPAYVEVGGKTYLAGVGSNSSGSAEEGTLGKYGAVNAYCRVSTHVSWINKTIAADSPSTVQWSKLVRTTKSWPKGAAGVWMKNFFDLFNGGDPARVAEFYATHRKPKPDVAPGKPNLDKLTESFRSMIETYGIYELRGYKTAGPYRMATLVYSPKEKLWRSLNLELEPKAPHRSTDFFSADEEAPKGVGGEVTKP